MEKGQIKMSNNLINNTRNTFLKWPGGKQWLAPQIKQIIMKYLNGRYIEPFLGGGAVFFNLQQKNAILSDINCELINTYMQVRKNYKKIQQLLKNLPVNKETYYKIRIENPKSKLDKAVRFLYLNRTCFSGLYRVNKKGQFNVPYGGGDRTPSLLIQTDILLNASLLLSEAQIYCLDFEKIINMSKKGDVIFCDPIYTTTHENNGFQKYNEKIFTWEDQKRLFNCALAAYKRGVFVLISNACHISISNLYQPFKPITLYRKSLLCPKPQMRRDVKEFLYIFNPYNTSTEIDNENLFFFQ